MNEHALERLEYPQVMEILASYATSGLGKREVGQLHPLSDRGEVERLLAETTELKVLLMPEQDLPIGGLHDVSFSLLKLEQGPIYCPSTRYWPWAIRCALRAMSETISPAREKAIRTWSQCQTTSASLMN
ncbi:MAG: hypothetical protein ACKVJG_22660 [Candidatus Latescibacterota bacterium]